MLLSHLPNSSAVQTWQRMLGENPLDVASFFSDSGPLARLSQGGSTTAFRAALPFAGVVSFVSMIRRNVDPGYTCAAFKEDVKVYATDIESLAANFESAAKKMTATEQFTISDKYLKNDVSGQIKLDRGDVLLMSSLFNIAASFLRLATFYEAGSGTVREIIDASGTVLVQKLNSFVGRLQEDVSYRKAAGEKFRKVFELYISALETISPQSLANTSEPRAAAAVADSMSTAQLLLGSYDEDKSVSIPALFSGYLSMNWRNLFDEDTPNAKLIASLPFAVNGFQKTVLVDLFWDSFLTDLMDISSIPSRSPQQFLLQFVSHLYSKDVLRGLGTKLEMVRVANHVIHR